MRSSWSKLHCCWFLRQWKLRVEHCTSDVNIFFIFWRMTRMMVMISGDRGGGDRWRRLRLRRKCRNCSYTTRLSRLHATGCYSRWKLTTTNCQLHFWPKQYICANSYTCRFSFNMNMEKYKIMMLYSSDLSPLSRWNWAVLTKRPRLLSTRQLIPIRWFLFFSIF